MKNQHPESFTLACSHCVCRGMSDTPGDTPAPAFSPSPDGARAKSMVSSLAMDTRECLDCLDAIDVRLGLDRRKNHEAYLNEVRGGVAVYAKRIEGSVTTAASVSDPGKGLIDLEARIAAAKAMMMAGEESEAAAKRTHSDNVKLVKAMEKSLRAMDVLAASAGDDPVPNEDTAKLAALDGYTRGDLPKT
jgi:hypothetical protein